MSYCFGFATTSSAWSRVPGSRVNVTMGVRAMHVEKRDGPEREYSGVKTAPQRLVT